MKQNELATHSSNTLDRLAEIRMNPGDGYRDKACLRQSELLADMLMRADAELCRVLAFAGQGIRALARRTTMCAVTAEPN